MVDFEGLKYPSWSLRWAERKMKRHLSKGGDEPTHTDLRNVRDWLHYIENTPFQSKLDRIQWPVAMTMQKEWHDSLAAKELKVEECGGAPDDVEELVALPGGWRWVRLTSPEALVYEGNAMGHCVGNGGYHDDEQVILSLRDVHNYPHCTIATDEGMEQIDQIYGRANSSLKPMHVARFVELLNAKMKSAYLDPESNQSLAYMNLIFNGQRYITLEEYAPVSPATELDTVQFPHGAHFKKMLHLELTNYPIMASGEFTILDSEHLVRIGPSISFERGISSDCLLENLKNLKVLPEIYDAETVTLSNLPGLSSVVLQEVDEDIRLSDLENVHTVGWLEAGSRIEVTDLPNLHTLSGVDASEVTIENCASLFLIHEISSSVDNLTIKNCPNLRLELDEGRFSCLKIENCPGIQVQPKISHRP